MDNTNSTTTYMLIKYGKLHRLTELLEKGILYLGPIESVRAGGDSKKDDHRIDYLEGAERYFSHGPLELTMTPLNGKPIKIQAQNLTYAVKSEKVIGNVCSFYSVDDKCFKGLNFNQIDRQMHEFGAHAILITNVDEFIKRITKAMPEPGWISLWYGNVEYFNEKDFVGDLHMFKKRSTYSYQNEFRVFVQSNQEKGVTLHLGPLLFCHTCNIGRPPHSFFVHPGSHPKLPSQTARGISSASAIRSIPLRFWPAKKAGLQLHFISLIAAALVKKSFR